MLSEEKKGEKKKKKKNFKERKKSLFPFSSRRRLEKLKKKKERKKRENRRRKEVVACNTSAGARWTTGALLLRDQRVTAMTRYASDFVEREQRARKWCLGRVLFFRFVMLIFDDPSTAVLRLDETNEERKKRKKRPREEIEILRR